MKIGIPKESKDNRVAMTPTAMSKMKSEKVEFLVEKGAGENASLLDSTYAEVATITDRISIFKDSNIIITVQPLTDEELAKIKKGTLIISMFAPYVDNSIIAKLQ